MRISTNNLNKGSSALRRGRFSDRNHVYHVTTRTLDRAQIFTDFRIGRMVVQALRREDAAGHTETLAFVVMPDHLHWLVRIAGDRSLSVSVNTIKSYSARSVNRLMNRSGQVWQKGFHDHGIRADEDLAATARYIVANPLRAGLVTRFGEYPHWDAKWL